MRYVSCVSEAFGGGFRDEGFVEREREAEELRRLVVLAAV